jgi:tetratricopeptide (TPR) repeat protein
MAPDGDLGSTLAVSEITQAEGLEPDNPDVAYGRGEVELALGHMAEARAAFRRAIVRSPGEPRYAFAVGMSLVRETFGSIAHAQELADIAEGLVSTATAPQEHALVGFYLLRTGRATLASGHAEKAFREDRRCGYCAKVLAEVTAEQGDPERAVAVLEQALSASLDGPQDRALLADLAKYRAMPRLPEFELVKPAATSH